MSAYLTTPIVSITNDLLPGVIALGTIATISTVSVSFLLLHLLIIALVSRRGRNHDERIFIRTHLGALVLCLLFSDLIQGLSGMIQLVWVSNRQVTTGSLCTAQAVLLHIGDVGTAFWNSIIAFHTFWTVVLGKRMTTLCVASLIAAGWTLCFVFTIIGPFAIQTKENGPFYAIAGAWCFITSNYKYPRILLHYLPMLLSAVTITILYLHVALVLFGVLTTDGGTWRFKAPTRKSANAIRDFFGQFSWSRLHRGSAPGVDQSVGNRGAKRPTQTEVSVFDNQSSSRPLRLKMLGIKMLWYPSVYLVLILPMAVTRIDPSVNISLDVILGFTCLLLCMGTANTIIYLCTRSLGPVPWSRRELSHPHSRSKAEGGHVGTTLSRGDISMQIQVDRYTKRDMDDQSVDLTRKKSTANSLTDISSISSIPRVVGGDSGDDFTRTYGDSKVGFDFTGGKATRHVLPPSSAPGPLIIVGVHESPVHTLGHQEQHSSHTLSPPKPSLRKHEQLQEQAHLGPHPYAYTHSPP